MKIRIARRLWLAIAFTTCLGISWCNAARPQPCSPLSIGVPPDEADTSVVSWGCRGWGEVFPAPDTLIHSISVWGPAPLDNRRRELFITETGYDSVYGFGAYPDVNRVLFGPSLLTPSPWDGVHAPEYRYVFDPPFALPHRGYFFFDIMAETVSSYPDLASTTNPYANGAIWETGPVWDCSQPGAPYGDSPTWDMAFEVQFCGAGAVGVPPPGARDLSLTTAPNPFQREVRVTFDLPSTTYVHLAVFDLAGRRLASLVDGELGPGPHSASWGPPRGGHGRAGTSLYFIRMEAAGRRLSRTVVKIE